MGGSKQPAVLVGQPAGEQQWTYPRPSRTRLYPYLGATRQAFTGLTWKRGNDNVASVVWGMLAFMWQRELTSAGMEGKQNLAQLKPPMTMHRPEWAQ